MKFTFGICVGNLTILERTSLLVNIVREMPNNGQWEILLIGQRPNDWHDDSRTRWIDFDETQTPKAWITRKKNILAQEARFENVVLMHEYFRLGEDWYDGWVHYGNDFDVACNCIMTKEGFRHSDWVIDPYLLWEIRPELKDKFWDVALPYDETRFNGAQYISGGYFVTKKQFILDNPLDESLVWGDAEDIAWSRQIRKKTLFKFNPWSYVTINKPNKWAPGLMPAEYLMDVAEHISK